MKKNLYVLGAVALLSLTGCASGDGGAPAGNGAPAPQEESSDASSFDFTDRSAQASVSGPSITFTINDDLQAVGGDYTDDRVFDAITVTGLKVKDPKFCAVEYTFDYADGVDIDTLVDGYLELYPTLEGDRTEAVSGILGFDGFRGDRAIGEPDLDNPSPLMLWVADDSESATWVTDCATDPYESDSADIPVEFWSAGTSADGKFSQDAFAQADLTVMKNGDVTVNVYEAYDFVQDSNGEWIAD